MADLNPFYSNVSTPVRQELDARKSRIGAYDRAEKLKWTYDKTAFAQLINEVDPRNKLILSSLEGGFENIYDSKDSYRPHPFITNVTISNEGRYGSVRKAIIEFAVHTTAQLESYENQFMTPRTPLTLRIGWSVSSGKDKVGIEEMKGIVYNFGWNVRDDGGFDCSVNLIGEGFFAKGLSLKTTLNKDHIQLKNDVSSDAAVNALSKVAPSIKDVLKDDIITFWQYAGGKGEVEDIISVASGEKNISDFEGSVGDINSNIRFKAFPNKSGGPNERNGHIYGVRFPQSQTSAGTGTGDETIPITEVYVDLYYIVNNLINDLILGYIKEPIFKDKKTRYVINNEITKGHWDKELFSSNPIDVAFPDATMGVYGENFRFDPSYIRSKVLIDGKYIDLGYTLINVQIVFDLIKEIEETKDQDIDGPLNKFFEGLFQKIYECSGEAYKLVLIMHDEDPKDKLAGTIQIVDSNMTDYDSRGKNEQVVPYEFNPFHKDTIVRKISMSSKLPDKMATALYVGGARNLSGTDSATASLLSGRPFKTIEQDLKEASSVNPNSNKVDLKKNTIDGYAAILEVFGWTRQKGAALGGPVSYVTDIIIAPGGGHIGREELNDNGFEKLKATALKVVQEHADELSPSKIKDLMGITGATPTLIDIAKNILLKYTKGPASLSKWNNRVIYPIEMSITLDGISGFRFGNVVTSNYLPQKYRVSPYGGSDYSLVFVVTKIDHRVSAGDWETNLTTQCRLSIDPEIVRSLGK